MRSSTSNSGREERHSALVRRRTEGGDGRGGGVRVGLPAPLVFDREPHDHQGPHPAPPPEVELLDEPGDPPLVELHGEAEVGIRLEEILLDEAFWTCQGFRHARHLFRPPESGDPHQHLPHRPRERRIELPLIPLRDPSGVEVRVELEAFAKPVPGRLGQPRPCPGGEIREQQHRRHEARAAPPLRSLAPSSKSLRHALNLQ